MLLCKDAAFIGGEGQSYQVIFFDRPYFEHASSDATVPLEKTTKHGGRKTAEVFFTGTEPKDAFTSQSDQVPAMLGETVNYLVTQYGETDTFKACPAEVKGSLILMWLASKGEALEISKRLQKGNRVAVVSPEVAEAKAIAAIIADGKRRGKSFTESQAQKIRQAQLALEAELG